MREILVSDPALAGTALPLLQSSLIPPGFRHGFTTRRGGVSGAPFDSLNLGAKWGDAPANLAENQRRLEVAAGGRRVFFATQVHGRESVRVSASDHPTAIAAVRADAVITADAGVAVGAFTADCVPVLIADVRSGACAAVHAGWRGTVAGVVSTTLRRMAAELGTRLKDVRLAIGPSIGPCCFEVGPEVIEAAEAAFPEARAAGAIHEARAGAAGESAARPHLDLWLLNSLAAQSVGVPASAIDLGGVCTSCDPARFFSYRRDRGHTGQLAAFIVRDQDPRNTTP